MDDDLFRVDKTVNRKRDSLGVCWKDGLVEDGIRDFLVQLPSHSDRDGNQAQEFMNQLLYPLRFQETRWKVGLASVLLPTAQVSWISKMICFVRSHGPRVTVLLGPWTQMMRWPLKPRTFDPRSGNWRAGRRSCNLYLTSLWTDWQKMSSSRMWDWKIINIKKILPCLQVGWEGIGYRQHGHVHQKWLASETARSDCRSSVSTGNGMGGFTGRSRLLLRRT